LVPLELNNNSILPPLPNHPSRISSQDNLHSAVGAQVNGIGKSIFQQPVHISTPAPSPPPSPAGPSGKGGKKQNYQTNQNFPFLYPPLDYSSNTVGGKGNAGLQDRLVGKRWEGCDIPASILEAGQLFASRMRMSRSMRQMWEVREEFMKFERGWDEIESKRQGFEEMMSRLNLEDADLGAKGGEEEEEVGLQDDANIDRESQEKRRSTETDDRDVQERLDSVETFYVSKRLLSQPQ
jgi:hypothetical protein